MSWKTPRTCGRLVALASRRQPFRSILGLGIVVATWWGLAFGIVVLAVPAPELAGGASSPVLAPGRLASVSTPTGVPWAIPVDRASYYEHGPVSLDQDGGSGAQADARPGWVTVMHGQLVRIIDVDRAAVLVELLDGPDPGGRGWLKVGWLRPYAGAL